MPPGHPGWLDNPGRLRLISCAGSGLFLAVLFNSLGFICVFVPVVVAVFFLLGRYREDLAGFWLSAASLWFYGHWNVRYVPLLLGSIAFNYLAGRGIESSHGRRARWLLTGAVAGNLALLGYYKYAHFFVDTLHRAGYPSLSIGEIILPLGISFFTFTQIAFLVDTYRGKVREYRFTHYLLFVTYFPHLIAGPILHHAQMMPQFAARPTYRWQWSNANAGLTIFVLGLFKKSVLADLFAVGANTVFNAAAHGAAPHFAEAWLGTLAYTLQLYFDFSGYCDMAIGVSLLLNIRLPINFDSPYKAVNIIDFWRRWHITLSTFLRDYLYIPLGGNRHGGARRYGNLLATMLLGGLWHGAGWTFVLWGGLHGIYLVVNHAFHALRRTLGWGDRRFGPAGRVAATAATFLAVAVAWSIFRAADLPTAGRMLAGLCGAHGVSPALAPAFGELRSPWMIGPLAVGLLIVWTLPNSQEWMRLWEPSSEPSTARPPAAHPLAFWRSHSSWTGFAFGVVLALILLRLAGGAPSEFLYFQF